MDIERYIFQVFDDVHHMLFERCVRPSVHYYLTIILHNFGTANLPIDVCGGSDTSDEQALVARSQREKA